MENTDQKNGLMLIGILAIASVLFIIIAGNQVNKTPEKIDIPPYVPTTNKTVSNVQDNNELKSEIDDMLLVLNRIHHISLVNQTPNNPDELIVVELQESMNDLNKLENLEYQINNLVQSNNEIISTTALVAETARILLMNAYKNWILYLKDFDVFDIDVSEFQYQLALFQTDTHDAYLQLVENASYLPMVAVEFDGGDGSNNKINQEIASHFMSSIDKIFSETLSDNETFHSNTGNQYAIAILINGYKEFFQ